MRPLCESLIPRFLGCLFVVVGDEIANLCRGRLIDEILKFFERKLYLPKPVEVREREKKE